MKVKDIMKTNVVMVTPDTKITEVADILIRHRFHGVPVVEGKKLVGIITEDDFFLKDSARLYLPSYIGLLRETKVLGEMSPDKKEKVNRLLNATARDIMSPGCQSISQEVELEDLLHFFQETKFTTVPVTEEDGVLIGIVTLIDVISLIKVVQSK